MAMMRFLTRSMRYFGDTKSIIGNQLPQVAISRSSFATRKKSSLVSKPATLRTVSASTALKTSGTFLRQQFLIGEAKKEAKQGLIQYPESSRQRQRSLTTATSPSTTDGTSFSQNEAITTIGLRLKRTERSIFHALQSYRFIGQTYGDKKPLDYDALKNEIKKLLDRMVARLGAIEEMYIAYKKEPSNKMLAQSIVKTWDEFICETEQAANRIQNKANHLNPPFPDSQQQHLDTILREVQNCMRSEAKLSKEDLKYNIKRMLLKTALKKIGAAFNAVTKPPTCFICYSWSNDANVRWVHQIARDLTSAGIRVRLDIWHNTQDSIAAFTDLIAEVDKVVVVGTPDLVDKWKNFTSSGRSRGKTGDDYEGHFIISEIKKILLRLNKKPNGEHGVINILLQGDEASLPGELEELSFIGTDFRDKTQYMDALFSLLVKLVSMPTPEDEKVQTNSLDVLSQAKKSLLEKWRRVEKWGEEQLLTVYQQSSGPDKQTFTEIDEEISNDLNQWEQASSFRSKSRLTTPGDVDELKVMIKLQYKNQKLYQLFKSGALQKKLLSEYYIRLGLIKQAIHSHPEQSPTDSFSTRFNSSLSIVRGPGEQNIPIAEEELFKRQMGDSYDIRHVVIEGAPGIGKTTFCRHIVLQWAQGAPWLAHYDWCIFVPLRDLWFKLEKAKRFDPILLWQYLLPDCDFNQLDFLVTKIEQRKQKTLFVIDAFDEVMQHQNHPLIKQALKYLFNQEYFILTSRQNHGVSTLDMDIDRHLQIAGFSKEEACAYVDKYFKDSPDKAKELKELIVHNAHFQPIISTPILLEIFCWLSRRSVHATEMTVISDLYHRFLTELIRWNLNKSWIVQAMDLTEKELLQHPDYAPAIECLQKLAYELFLEGKYIVDSEQLKLIHEKNAFPLPVLQTAFLKIGFTRPWIYEERLYENNFYFIHLTIQEYLVARHWVKLFTSYRDVDKVAAKKIFIDNKHNPQFQMIWPFVAGILNKEHDLAVLNAYFNHLLEAPRDLTGVFELLLLIRCLNETKFQGKLVIEQLVIVDVINYLRNQILNINEINSSIKLFINKLKNYNYALMSLCVLDILVQACSHQRVDICLESANLLLSIEKEIPTAVDTIKRLMQHGDVRNKGHILAGMLNSDSFYIKCFEKSQLVGFLVDILEQKFSWWEREPALLKLYAAFVLLKLEDYTIAIEVIVSALKHWSAAIRRQALVLIGEGKINHPEVIKALHNFNLFLPMLIRFPLLISPQALRGILAFGYIHSLYFLPQWFELLTAEVLIEVSPRDHVAIEIFESAKRHWLKPVRLFAAERYHSTFTENIRRNPSRLSDSVSSIENEEYIAHAALKMKTSLNLSDDDDMLAFSCKRMTEKAPLEVLLRVYCDNDVGIWHDDLLVSSIISKTIEHETPLYLYNDKFHYFYKGKMKEEYSNKFKSSRLASFKNQFFQLPDLNPKIHEKEKENDASFSKKLSNLIFGKRK